MRAKTFAWKSVIVTDYLVRQFQKNKIPKTTTLLYAYKSYVTNCLLTQSRRAAENERRLIKGVGIL
ncbi:MAG: hypothetical protein VSS75_019185, partial [Candidatus Parabeggiatoa sp.]|nr:hypothetical protein [Candidatus Parabeggiatoa sp.]